MPMILPTFAQFPNESAIIGRLLAGYSILEIDLLNCVQMATGDFDAALKALFRIRGEARRIEAGEKLAAPIYTSLGLAPDFGEAIAAMRHCRLIRNQYAHCQWWNDADGRFVFANLEDVAKQSWPVQSLRTLPPRYVKASLLNDQEAFFKYTDDILAWVNYEGRLRAGKLANQPLAKPQRLSQPPLHIP
jgi:hypothetical protein